MKCESLQFSDLALRNVMIRGDSKVLQLCLKSNQTIAKRRVPDSALMVVVSGSDAVLIQPAEEHAVSAVEDSVVLLILMPREQDHPRVDDRRASEDTLSQNRKEQIAYERGAAQC